MNLYDNKAHSDLRLENECKHRSISAEGSSGNGA